MELDHEFTVPVPVDRAWSVLLDVQRVALCVPGATLDSADGDEYAGRLRVKVGAMTITYRGTARITSADEAARTVTIEAAAKEARGSGTAAATVTASLHDEGATTRVTVRTKLNVTGRPAQFGRGILAEVGGKLIARFARNLAAELESPAAERPAETVVTAAAARPAKPAAPAEPVAPAEAAEDGPPADGLAAVPPPAGAGAAPAPEVVASGPAVAGLAAVPPAPEAAEPPAGDPVDQQGAAEVLRDAERDTGPVAPVAVPAPDPQAAVQEVRDAGAAEAPRPAAPPASVTPLRPVPAAARDDDAIDLLEFAGPSLAKRAAPVAGALVLLLLVLRFLVRRRRG
ncbi:SRPBCC family protein [Actinomadura parmotrematis]|uniref:SRPBCC family protein n=1 Tax=Actinomadura parmotrematis TaxID=2864039 RepID=UPI00215D8A27|nr:SRPBCC family protein [Actinomadura parmotrematis]